jgi:MFS family permease
VGTRDLRIVVAAVGVSAAGDLAAVSALAVSLAHRTGSGVLVAALFAANWLALAAAASWGGALVDRGDARRLLAAASLLQAAITAALATTSAPAVTLALVAVLGLGAAVALPAEFALVGAIAAGSVGAGRANAHVETARSAGYLVGPLLGTSLAATAGVGAALAVDAASFVVVAAGALALHVRRPGQSAAAARPRARDGILLLAGDRVLSTVTAVLVGSLLAMSTSISADVFFGATLGAGSAGLALLLTAWTAGMLAGSLVAAPRIPPKALAVTAVAATALQGAGKLGAAAVGLLVPVLLLYAAGGAGHGIKNVTARALIHERIAPEAHGRTFAAYAALRNCAELAALAAGGFLVDALGGRTTILLAGAATTVVAAVGYGVLRRRTPAESQPAASPAAA